MKKTFFQLHAGFLFVTFLFLIFFLFGLLAVIVGFSSEFDGQIASRLLVIPGGFFWMAACIWSIYASWYNRIIFFDDKTIITGDKLDKDSKIQFRDEISYSQIKDLKFIISNRNSKKKSFPWYVRNGSAPKSYFEFEMENGKTKWVFIFYFSKKQRKEMIKIINEKTGLNLDYDVLYKNYEHRPIRKKKTKAK